MAHFREIMSPHKCGNNNQALKAFCLRFSEEENTLHFAPILELVVYII